MKRLSSSIVSMLLLLLLSAPTFAAAPLTWQRAGSLPANPNVWGGQGLAYGNGQFLMLDGNTGIHTSADGTHWTTPPANGLPWAPIKFLAGRFIGGGNSGNGKYITASDDGLSWNDVVVLDIGPGVGSMAYGNGRYLVASDHQMDILSPDLKHLPGRNPGYDSVPGLAYGRGLFVAASRGLYYTTDGQTWTEALPPFGDTNSVTRFSGVAYGEGRFVAAGRLEVEAGRYKAMLYTSTDGKQWQQVSVDSDPINGVLFGGNQFLAWNANSVLTSADGEHWTAGANPNGAKLFTYGAGRFMAVGDDRTVMTATVCGTRFPDVAASDPNCDAIEALANRQILSGYPDGAFQPASQVTRAEMAKMLVLTLGLKPEPQDSLPFTDTSNNWAARDGYLQAAIAAGLINGYPDGTFRPGQPVTRAEAVKMIAAAAGLQPESGTAYADIKNGDWFAGWVAAARNHDLIGAGGYHSLWAANQFRGTAATGRGETATLLDNLSNH